MPISPLQGAGTLRVFAFSYMETSQFPAKRCLLPSEAGGGGLIKRSL